MKIEDFKRITNVIRNYVDSNKLVSINLLADMESGTAANIHQGTPNEVKDLLVTVLDSDPVLLNVIFGALFTICVRSVENEKEADSLREMFMSLESQIRGSLGNPEIEEVVREVPKMEINVGKFKENPKADA